MIHLDWRSSLDAEEAAEVAVLLDEAARYDEEAGFSTARPDQGDWHLLVRMGPRGGRGSAELELLPEAALVAYLHLRSVGAHSLQAQLVVHPEVRSLGVGTLTVERLLADGGWPGGAGRDVQVWSHGSHPAAERMSRRFGATLAAAVAKTVCYLPELEQVGDGTPYRHEAASFRDVLAGHAQAAAPAARGLLDLEGVAHLDQDGGGVLVASAGPGGAHVAVVRSSEQSRDDLTRLLVHGCSVAREGGARLAVLYLDATDEELVHAALSVGFVHEHSDLRYDLAGASV